MYISTTTIAFLVTLTSTIQANPLPAPPHHNLFRRTDITGCNAEQKKHIEKSLSQVSGLAVGAYGVLGQDKEKWSKNKGFTHYFKESDYGKVKGAYEELMSIGEERSKIKFKIKCGTASECPSGSFAHAEAPAESFEGHGFKKGTRIITVCPSFFTDPRTTGELPPADDKEGLKKYCQNKESKKIKDFEVGGHTLLHEISHLDSFGLAAGYTEHTEKTKDDKGGEFEYKYHGTIDWKNKSTAGNARTLKNSKAKDRPENWENAESLAAAATEMGAMWRCDLTDIDY